MRRSLLLALLIGAGFGIWQWWQVAVPDVDTSPPPASVQTAPTGGQAASAPAETAALPTRDLAVDESRGGHTLARHVGLTDAALRARLAREPGISAASTYTDRAIAERTVGRVLADQSDRIKAWASRKGSRPNLALSYRGSPKQLIGRTLPRGRRDPIPSTDAVIVLRWDGRDFYVLTSYPEVRR